MLNQGAACHPTREEVLHSQVEYKREVTKWVWQYVWAMLACGRVRARARGQVPDKIRG